MSEANPELMHSRGVGALLTVNTHTRAMNRFFGGIPGSYGTPIDRDIAHITIIDNRETERRILSESDLIVLRNADESITRYLASLPLQSVAIRPASPRLEKVGNHAAINFGGNDFLIDVRGALTEIVFNETGIELGDEKFAPHMSVTNLRRPLPATRRRVAIPQKAHLNGFYVGQRTRLHKGGQLKSKPTGKPKYVNRSPRH